MSSAVNKSNKRFVPKAPQARGGPRKPRQLSSTQPPASPIVPPAAPKTTPSTSTSTNKPERASVLSTPAPTQESESAIIEDDEEEENDNVIAPPSYSISTPAPTQGEHEPTAQKTSEQAEEPGQDEPGATKQRKASVVTAGDGAVRPTLQPPSRPRDTPEPEPSRVATPASVARPSPAGRLQSLQKKKASFTPLQRPTKLQKPSPTPATPVRPPPSSSRKSVEPEQRPTPAPASAPAPAPALTPRKPLESTSKSKLSGNRRTSRSTDRSGVAGENADKGSTPQPQIQKPVKEKKVKRDGPVFPSTPAMRLRQQRMKEQGPEHELGNSSSGSEDEGNEPESQNDTPVRYDEDGRMVLDPDDLPKAGRGIRPRSVYEAEKKVINAETFTMAHLCKELPIGKVNEDYTRYEEARAKRKEAREKYLAARKIARATGKALPTFSNEAEERQREEIERKRSEWGKDFQNVSGIASAGKSAPQLVMDDQGKFNIDQESMVVDRHENAQQDQTYTREEQVEDKYNNVMNSSTFSGRERAERWDDTETREFYRALSQWGTDFNLISELFPGRDRRQIKCKFKLEERRNPTKVHLAILRKLPVDLDQFSSKINKELHTVESIEQELQEIRQRHEVDMKLQEESLAQAKKEDAEAAQKRERQQYSGSNKRRKIKTDVGLDQAAGTEEVIGHL